MDTHDIQSNYLPKNSGFHRRLNIIALDTKVKRFRIFSKEKFSTRTRPSEKTVSTLEGIRGKNGPLSIGGAGNNSHGKVLFLFYLGSYLYVR